MAIDQIEETGIKFFKQCNSLCNGAKTSWNGILYQCDFRILLSPLGLIAGSEYIFFRFLAGSQLVDKAKDY